jgi:protein-L-isoaspartate(D-aspartate) O-methyltransferase
MTAAEARAFLAEEIRVTASIQSPRLVHAMRTTPREKFLGPGPWTIYTRGAGDLGAGGGPRQTDDDDPRHVYHDVPVAIDATRHLYNGQPSLIAGWLELLGLREGERVAHIGCGTGYFTAWIAEMVGPGGAVSAFDVDPALAERARENLAAQPWVTVAHGNGMRDLPGTNDVILVHAGGTHALDAWLDTLADSGRLLLPLTMSVPGMPSGISKGMMLLVTRRGAEFAARAFGMVAIYSLKDARDEALGAELGKAMMTGGLMNVARVRRDAHARLDTCVVHGPTSCLSR